ncbi:PAS domain S-box protein [Candidatus Acetothermia bacterium]|nr:PAS domain S-box protein [Candidatus Acetothermia bacterium]MBI3642627.1 PAS domain S-box protein [Candidatus Acetothermia bacterium]
MARQPEHDDSGSYQTEARALQQQNEQYSTQLQIIKSIQQGLARKLGITVIYELVGEKLQELFPQFEITTFAYDPGSGMITAPFISQRGKRLSIPPFKLQDHGVINKLLQTQESIVINKNFDEEAAKIGDDLVGELEPAKSSLYVPLLLNDELRGAVVLRDLEREHAISDADVLFLETIASSMSIALESARLSDEAQRRNQEISEALDQQTATSNVLRALSGFQPDLRSLLDIIAENAAKVCGADDAHIYRIENDRLKQWTHRGPIPGLEAGESLPLDRDSLIGRTILDRQIIHIRDAAVELTESEYPVSATLQRRWGIRTVLTVPLLRDGEPIGGIAIRRKEVRAFTEKQIELIKTFADQAVIAIENVRLFDEVRSQTQYLEALLQNSPVAIVVIDPDANVVSWNPSATRLFGYQAAEALGRNVDDLVANNIAVREEAVAYSTRVASKGEVRVMTQRTRKDGTLVDVELLSLPVIVDGVQVGFIAIYHDISEQKRVEEALREQKQYFEALVQNSPVAIVVIDSDGRVFSWNPAAERLFGYTETESIGNNIDDLVAKNDSIRAEAVGFNRQASRGELVHGVTRRTRKDGTMVDVELVGVPVRVSENNFRFMCMYHDITELKLVDEELRQQKEYFEALVRNSPVAIVAIDLKASVVSWNPVAEKLFGFTEAEALGRNVDDLVAKMADQDVQSEAVEFNYQAARGDLIHAFTQRSRKDGTLVDVELLALPVVVDGEQIGIIVIYHDITERKRFEQELRRQKEYFEALVLNNPVAVVAIDQESNIVSWNPAAEKLFGYAQEEAIGRNVDELVANVKAIRHEAVKYSGQASHGDKVHVITRRNRKDGTLLDVELLGLPIIVAGEQVGFIAIYHDITELQRARHEAEAANEAKSAFLANMSHEIRTPMNAVIGMSGLLMDTNLTQEQREYAETIRNSSDTLLTIINDILDFSKIEAGKMELENQPFDLRECVESALDLVAGRAAERGLDLAYILDDEVPSAVRGDVTRLRQILLNLLSNGIKFTEKGEVIVEVSRGQARDELIFSVRDTGIGISKEGMKRIFQSFSQADSSTTRKYGGTGLGLAISKRLAEMMGGNMWAESAGLSGKGSTFFFTMKAATAKIARGRALNLSGRQPEVEGKRILIVDDNETNCRILELQTQKWGILSRSTRSAKKAMSLLKTGEEFDLAILDMHMPEMDGIDLAKEMRSLPQAKKLPLILLTSLGQHELEAAEAGFVAHLTKPVKPSQLFDAIATVFTATGKKRPYASAAKRTKPKLDSTLGERHPLHILLAEDNAVNQKVALRLLDQMGYRADVASNGLEAIESVERQPYDVILMDVQMPEMDGLEATRRIVAARSKKKSRPYIIAMTANAMQGDREMCMEAGMDDYVTKPINIEELTGALLKAPSRKQVN